MRRGRVLTCAALAHGRGCGLCSRMQDGREVVAPSGFDTRTGQGPERPEAPAFALETTAQSQRRPGGPALGGPILRPPGLPSLPHLPPAPNPPGEPPGETWLRSRETSRAASPCLTLPGVYSLTGSQPWSWTDHCALHLPFRHCNTPPHGMVTGGGPWGGSRWCGWSPGEGNQRPSEREPQPGPPREAARRGQQRATQRATQALRGAPCCCRPDSAFHSNQENGNR